jgi:threonine/homoserine/homoserine lactone efflux protein
MSVFFVAFGALLILNGLDLMPPFLSGKWWITIIGVGFLVGAITFITESRAREARRKEAARWIRQNNSSLRSSTWNRSNDE